MSKTTAPPRTCHRMDVALELRADGDLPPGIAGRLTGIALTYDVVDTYDTIFARGCAKRSIDMKVAARKLPLLMDHDRSVRAHVGVVASMTDVGDALVMTADLLDTPEGRAAKEYAQAVIAAGTSTGFSIGFVPRRAERVVVDGRPVERFLEIELREVSLTPMPAVPGTGLTAARADDIAPDVPEQPAPAERTDADLLTLAARVALDALSDDARSRVLDAYRPMPVAEIPTARTDATAPGITLDLRPAPATVTATAAPTAHAVVSPTMADRIAAVRSSYRI